MKNLLFILTILTFSHTLSAQAKPDIRQPVILGITNQVQSAELGETRTINIYFPPGYNPRSDTAYPVIYLLDGGASEDFIHVTGVVQFLSQIVDTMPRAIVVGITNVDRKRDFTFAKDEKYKKDIPQAGGSAKFIAFIEKELQPYISKHYKVGEYKTLIGQSLGGLLASEILLRKPDLFDAYLIVSPSLWWSGEALLRQPTTLKTSYKDLHIYIAVGGGEEEIMKTDAQKLKDILQASGKSNLKVELQTLPDENHLTILHNAVYKGLEILFSHP